MGGALPPGTLQPAPWPNGTGTTIFIKKLKIISFIHIIYSRKNSCLKHIPFTRSIFQDFTIILQYSAITIHFKNFHKLQYIIFHMRISTFFAYLSHLQSTQCYLTLHKTRKNRKKQGRKKKLKISSGVRQKNKSSRLEVGFRSGQLGQRRLQTNISPKQKMSCSEMPTFSPKRWRFLLELESPSRKYLAIFAKNKYFFFKCKIVKLILILIRYLDRLG